MHLSDEIGNDADSDEEEDPLRAEELQRVKATLGADQIPCNHATQTGEEEGYLQGARKP